MRSLRRLNISVRVLLLVVTLCCVWLGWQARLNRRQATALAELSSLGAQFPQEPPGDALATWLLGRRATVTDVTFLGPQVTDETVDEIVDCVARLRGLDRLTFVESGLTSAGRQRLERQLPHLEIRMIVPVMESIPFPIR